MGCVGKSRRLIEFFQVGREDLSTRVGPIAMPMHTWVAVCSEA